MQHTTRDPSQSPTGRTRGGYRFVVLGVLTLIYAMNFLDRQILSVLNEPIKNELHLSDTQMGMLSGLTFALFYTTFGIPVAWLADRMNRVRIIAVACALWSLCSAACGLAGSFAQLALARIGVGVGEAGGSPPSYSVVADYFEARERGTALAILSLGVALGPSIGAALGGWVSAYWGWRYAFFAAGLPGLGLSLLVLLVVREPLRGHMDGAPASAATAGLWQSIRDFLGNRTLTLTAVSSGLSAFVGYSIGAWVPAMLVRNKGMSLTDIAVYYSLMSGVVSAVGTMGSGMLVDWAGRRNVRAYALLPAFAFALALPFFLSAIAAPSWPLTLVLLAAPSLLTNTFLAPALAVVQNNVTAEKRSSSSALLLFVLNLVGLGGGPVFVGIISDHTAAQFGTDSLRIGLAALAPVFLLAVAAHVLASFSLQRDSRQRAAQSVLAAEFEVAP